MKLQQYTARCALFLLLWWGCATTESGEAEVWRLSEPDEPEEVGETDEHPGQPEQDEPNEQDDPSVLQPLDCSEIDEQEWAPEEFPFVLYRHFACQQPRQENIVFSPAALRIALAERASELGGAEGQAIAEQMGFSDVATFYEDTRNYRDALLERQPKPSQKKDIARIYDYEIEEEDPQRLFNAVGIEFYSLQCGEPTKEDCRWQAHNDRWSETFLSTDTVDGFDAATQPRTAGLMFRGQWEDPPSYQLGTLNFQVEGEQSVTLRRLIHSVDGESQTELGMAFQSRIAGGEISFFFITSWDHSLAAIENALSFEQQQLFLDSTARAHPMYGPRIRFPDFDMQQTVEVSEALHLEQPLRNTTRVAIDDRGLNFPEPVELVIDLDDSLLGGLPPSIEYYNLDNPFLFIVYDHPTESILLMGRVANPQSEP